MSLDDTDKWYKEFCDSYRKAKCKQCGHVGHEDAGSCDEGCCDKWRCPQCGHTFTIELG